MNLGRMIRRHRMKQKLTQLDLAKGLGLSSGQFISNIERGTSPLPPHQYRTLARLLQISKMLLIRAAVKDYQQFLIRQNRGSPEGKTITAPIQARKVKNQ